MIGAESGETARLPVAADGVDLLAVCAAAENEAEQEKCPEQDHPRIGDRVPRPGAEAEDREHLLPLVARMQALRLPGAELMVEHLQTMDGILDMPADDCVRALASV